MPKVAIDMGAADEVLPLENIAAAIRRIAGRAAATTQMQETGP
jgi:chemotaxis response regulator CheB